MLLAATGDVMLGRHAAEVVAQRPPAYAWGSTLPLLREADTVLVNLECVIAREETGAPWPRKVFHFKAPPAAIPALRAAGVAAVTLANNHSLDFGTAALAEMLDGLAAADIAAAGAGRTAAAAWESIVLPAAGLRVGVLNFTDNESRWEAGAATPGVCYVPVDLADERAGRLLAQVRAVRTACDILVAAAHWGPNMVAEPLPHHPSFARALADAGVDLILGTSAHIVQGIELYRPASRPGRVVPICYDLGDCVDDYAVDPVLRNDRSFLFVFDADRLGVSRVTLYPVLIDAWRCRVNRAEGVEATETMTTMAARCGRLGTAVGLTGEALVVDVAQAAAA